MPVVLFLVMVVFGLLWDMLIAGVCMLMFGAAEVPFLSTLDFWQMFTIVIAISLATMRFNSK